MSSAPAHYIRHNAASRVPSRWVFLDSEAVEERQGYDRVQSWRLAVTAADWRDKAGAPWKRSEWKIHRRPEELWRYVSTFTRANVRTVLVAHNLAYDLRITKGFDVLTGLGWRVHRISVHDRSVNAVMRRARSTLVLCDSLSWLPMGLGKIGALMGTHKVELPDMDGPEAEWVLRCKTDVAILRAAMLDLLAWVESDDLGNWQRTGAGMAWSIWRHRFYTHKVLVHTDERARDAEATAAYSGRCEAWRWGRMSSGPYVEWDLPLSYPRIARDALIPTKLIGHGTARSTKAFRSPKRTSRYLCHATVTTEAPVLPTSSGGRTLWPVGELVGWWWDDELTMAEDHGAKVAIDETYIYRGAPALKAWAEWVIELVESPPPGVSAVRQAAAKHFARALIGRFATRYTKWETEGPDEIGRDVIERVVDLDTGAFGRLLTLGSETLVGMSETYGVDAAVAVMSSVMAEGRRRLWQIMTAAGLEHVIYCDTDSIITDELGAERLAAWLGTGDGWGLRPKALYNRLHVLGPRQLIHDGKARISGVPSSARRVNGTTWAGETWSGLLGDLGRGQLSTVTIKPRSWKISGVDPRRLHLPDGSTAPIVLGWHEPAALPA